MDFFEEQARAQRQTRWLTLAFFGSVMLIVGLLSGLSWFALRYFGKAPEPYLVWLLSPAGLIVSTLVLAVIGGGALQRALQLRQGGTALALSLGALPATARENDPSVKRLLNIVEEMAIASGTPLPRVFILPHEAGINAFVAGSELRNTALVVTEGLLTLNRDELQGVVGHEYAHLAHGDLRLNTRLLIALGGLMFLSRVGRDLTGFSSARRVFGGRSRDRGNGAVVGLALLACGYIGVTLGRLMQAAISRQREFHADASAVQYTRNPEGLASALHRIRQHSAFSHLTHTSSADELNHLCISESLRVDRWMASHPPLPERIKRIDPGFERRLRIQTNQNKVKARQKADAGVPSSAAAAAMALTPVAPAAAGAWGAKELNFAAQARAWLEQKHPEATHSEGKQASLLLDLLGNPSGTPEAYRLPLLERLLASQKETPKESQRLLLNDARRVVQSKRSLASVCYLALVEHHLEEKAPRLAHKHDRDSLQGALSVVLSLFARLGAPDKAERAEALFTDSVKSFQDAGALRFESKTGAKALASSLHRLGYLRFDHQRALIKTGLEMIKADGVIRRQEYELLRICSEIMGIPLPPVLAPSANRSV